MKKELTLYFLLPLVTAAACFMELLLDAFAPAAILPHRDLMWIVVVTLITLVLERYLGGGAKRCWPLVAAYGLLSFSLLPWACGFLWGWALLRFALTGGVAFTVLTALYTILTDRLSATKATPLAPALAGFLLFLALQGTMGMVI